MDALPPLAGILTSGIDHPGYMTLNIYLPYCNYRCRDCHNWEIAQGAFHELPAEMLLWELDNNFIVNMAVITGGEPTLHRQRLVNMVKLIRQKRPDLLIRIDSNGSMPEVLMSLSDIVNGFAIDIKGPPFEREKYEYTIRVRLSVEKLIESVKIASKLPETIYRTVKYPWLSDKDIEKIKEFVKIYGEGRPYFVNPFVAPQRTVSASDANA
ncbi:MAG: radical SAM protein [Nitrososphaeria archaeon]